MSRYVRIIRWAARRQLGRDSVRRYAAGCPNLRCPCGDCDLARRVLEAEKEAA